LNGNDVGFTNNSENSYHVVTGNGTDTTAVIDGFTISGGNANAGTSPDYKGGGLRNDSGSPTVSNVIFSSNYAYYGGGMVSTGPYNPVLTNITFTNNTAVRGGGLLNNGSSPTLTNVTFSGNFASQTGGGMETWDSTPTLTNVTFRGNTATNYGGGMYNTGNSNPTVRNSILWGNTPTDPQVYNNGSSSSTTLTYSDVQGGGTSNGNINTDPLLGTLGNYGGSTQVLPLLPGSPAIDAGDPSNCPATDQRGVSRPQGARCDMGAYEAESYTLTIISAHGTVAKSPDKITYPEGDVVQLTATPSTGWSFANWTGGLTGSANPGSVTIHGNTSVTANYTQNEYTLTITSANGTVAKNPDQATYHEGDVVQLTATPSTGWSFANWTGGLTGAANPGSVTIHGNTAVTANYTLNTYRIYLPLVIR
jgi:predicted outer membrane repeat protein